MIITPFALAGFLLGLIFLFRASLVSMFSLFLIATLFGGSAAFILVALGGSSVPPAHFMLMFLTMRCILPGPGQMAALGDGIWANRFLIIFVLYAVFSAFTLPILFAHTMDVTPLRPIPGRDLYAVLPLTLSSQNITTAVYMVGTLLSGICAYIGMRRPGAAASFVRVSAWITLGHAFLGISGVLLANTAWDSILALFRNGNYAQLNQSFDGLVRMNGIWPEASGYAAYGLIWCILMLELWVRNILPRRTGPAGAVMAVALIVSTSSTAYVSLAAYALYFALRYAFAPWQLSSRKQLALVAAALACIVIILTTIVFIPALADYSWKLLNLMTVKKTESTSGLQRAFWAMQGIDVFLNSYGLGIGAGSFRSSSLITAILGSVGVIGSLSFAIHFLRGIRPFDPESYRMQNPSTDRAVGCAASTTALIMLVPASVASPSPDPGILWATMCGIALALRMRATERTRESVAR